MPSLAFSCRAGPLDNPSSLDVSWDDFMWSGSDPPPAPDDRVWTYRGFPPGAPMRPCMLIYGAASDQVTFDGWWRHE